MNRNTPEMEQALAACLAALPLFEKIYPNDNTPREALSMNPNTQHMLGDSALLMKYRSGDKAARYVATAGGAS